MSQTYTVAEVKGRREWEGGFGPMVSYDLALAGVEEKVELAQKPSSAAPQAGQEIVGTLEAGKYGLKLKKDKPAFTGGANGKWQPDPAKDARITRQHSQDMAIETLKLAHSLGFPLKDVDSVSAVLRAVKRLADVYDKDAYAAGELAGTPIATPRVDQW